MNALSDDSRISSSSETILKLLNEYSGKATNTLERLERAHDRRILAVGWFLGSALLVLSAVSVYRSSVTNVDPATSTLSLLGLLAATVSLLGAAFATYGIEKRMRMIKGEISIVQSQLRRLSHIALEFSEHTEQDLGPRLELELRLAEADGLLRYTKTAVGEPS